MPTKNNAIRYPELPEDITMPELVRRWSELVRALNARDASPIDPAEVFGRSIGVGGNNFQNVTFVTAGTSLPIAPTPAYWNIYQYQIPRDAGMIFVEPVPVSAAANIQIQTFLPLAQSVQERTITIAAGNTQGVAAAILNLAIFPTSGSGDVLVLPFGGSISIANEVSGSSNFAVSTSSAFLDNSGTPVPSGYYLAPVIGSGIGFNYAASIGASTAELKSNTIGTALKSSSSLTGSINIAVSSVATVVPALNYTFRAFGNKWIQIT